MSRQKYRRPSSGPKRSGHAIFDRGGGNWQDYAIAKFVALRLTGVAADDPHIVIMRNIFHGEDHAVTAARLDRRWLIAASN